MQRRKTIYLAIGLILFVFLYIWVEWKKSKIPQMTSTSVYGQSSLGVQLFYRLAEELDSDQVVVHRKSLWQGEIPPNAILFLLSPKKDLSSRYIEILSTFVERGGRLVLSFENNSSWLNIQPLLKKLQGPSKMTEDKQFKNAKLSIKSPKKNLSWLQTKENYAFYSRYWIEGEGCSKGSFSCYVRQWSHKKGEVTLMAGLPLFSNALLERKDNRQFAFRLIAEDAPLWFDEYHHFYSDHTFGQLLLKPSFGLPLLGMMICVWLFFILGHNRFSEAQTQQKKQPATASFHRLNENILEKRLEASGHYQNVLRLHQSFLEKIFPYAKNEIAALETHVAYGNHQQFLKRAQALIQLHRDLIARKKSLSK